MICFKQEERNIKTVKKFGLKLIVQKIKLHINKDEIKYGYKVPNMVDELYLHRGK